MKTSLHLKKLNSPKRQSHGTPSQTEEFIEISNFYTATVYEKGAEVVRVLNRLIGRESFFKGMELYFKRFDGQAVTQEDFVQCGRILRQRSLTVFKWYTETGTPKLTINVDYDAKLKTLSLEVEQNVSNQKNALKHIPCLFGLIDPNQGMISLDKENNTEVLLEIKKAEKFTFSNIAVKPVVSVFRDFSAPVIYHIDSSYKDSLARIKYDNDPFNRWQAGQDLMLKLIKKGIKDTSSFEKLDSQFVDTFTYLIKKEDPSLVSLMLTPPSFTAVSNELEKIPVESLLTSIKEMKVHLASLLSEALQEAYEAHHRESANLSIKPEHIASRRLKNACLSILSSGYSKESVEKVKKQFQTSENMTDRLCALEILSHWDSDYRLQALDSFYTEYSHDALVIDSWYKVQACTQMDNALDTVKQLTTHPSFDAKNPNRLRALYGSFFHRNPKGFHREDGKSYKFCADIVEQIDQSNPQAASRMARALVNWQKFDETRQDLMLKEIRELAKKDLSSDTFEIIKRAQKA